MKVSGNAIALADTAGKEITFTRTAYGWNVTTREGIWLGSFNATQIERNCIVENSSKYLIEGLTLVGIERDGYTITPELLVQVVRGSTDAQSNLHVGETWHIRQHQRRRLMAKYVDTLTGNTLLGLQEDEETRCTLKRIREELANYGYNVEQIAMIDEWAQQRDVAAVTSQELRKLLDVFENSLI